MDSNLTGHLINLKLELRKFSQSMSELNDSLVYLNHPKFTLKNIYIIPETVNDFRGKSSDIFMKDTAYYNGFKILHNKKLQFRLNDLTRDISLAEGQLYQKDLAEESYKGISALKVFKSVFLQFVKNPSYADKLDCYIVYLKNNQ